MSGKVFTKEDILGVAIFNVGAKLIKTFFYKCTIIAIPAWRIDHVYRIEMYSHLFSVNCLQKFKIGVWRIGESPWHRLKSKKSTCLLNCVNYFTCCLYNHVESFLREVLRIRSIPFFAT